MQGIGFADEISPADLAAVTERIGERLRGLRPATTRFHRPTIRPSAVYLTAEPREPLYQLRLAVHQAIASVVGLEHFGEAAPDPGKFAPHVSIAYASQDGQLPVQPVIEALRDGTVRAVTATFGTASLLVFRRDQHDFGWASATPLPIGAQ